MTTSTATKTTTNIQLAISTLHKAFDMANKVLFNNELPSVVITMHQRGKSNSLGWFTVNPAWVSGNSEFHEINISPENLNREPIEIIQTLVHEMIHLHCSVKGIKDTSRGNAYHNKKFLAESIAHGFEYLHESPHPKIGYSQITFTKSTANLVKFWNLDKSAFTISRKEFGTGAKDKKKSNIVKWMCGCGVIVRSSRPEVNIACMDCGTKFEKQD